MEKQTRKRDLGIAVGLCLAGMAVSASSNSGASDSPPAGTPQEILSRTSSAFNDIAQNSISAVVSISVVKSAEQPKLPLLPGMAEHPDLPQRSVGLGSGVIIRKDGYILTNDHVISDADRITVTLDEKHKMNARVIGADPKTDLAVIKLETRRSDFPTLGFGDSARIKVGDWALAIGSPFGLNRSVSSGIISAKGRAQMGILDIEDFIQTDAAINPGSSGGPLLNLNGEMIGINTAIFTQGSGFVGIGFAIPSRIAKEIAEQLIAHGRVSRGWVGMAAQDLDDDLARYFKAPSTEGALVSDVQPKGPASQAEVKPGDVVLEFDHHKIESAAQLKQLAGKKRSGDTVPLAILHHGEKRELDIRIGTQPVSSKELVAKKQQAGRAKPDRPKSLGLVVEDIPDELAPFLNLPSNEGALVSAVEPGSPAFESGLSPGDVILRADQSDIKNAKDFAKLSRKVIERKITMMLYIQRGPDEKLFVPVKLT